MVDQARQPWIVLANRQPIVLATDPFALLGTLLHVIALQQIGHGIQVVAT